MGVAQDDKDVVLGKVPTNKGMATPCSQTRKNVKGELAEIEQEIKNGTTGADGTSI